jgi:Raf kinase inhibitor-like YbhB/YbcL family protein
MLEKLPPSIGRALHGRRAGLEKSTIARLLMRRRLPSLQVESSAFGDHQPIPPVYTADGEGRWPELCWQWLPSATESLVVIVEDPDAPSLEPLVHAIVVNIAPNVRSLEDGLLSNGAPGSVPALHMGRNSYLRQTWLPPDPPPGHGPHHYLFQVFALSLGAAFSAAPGRQEVQEIVGHFAIAAGHAAGVYERLDSRRKH